MKKYWLLACVLLTLSAACNDSSNGDGTAVMEDRMFNGYPVLPYAITDYQFENGQSDKVLVSITPTLQANSEKILANTLEFLRDSIMRNEPQVRMMAIYLYKDPKMATTDAAHSNWQSMLLQVSEKEYKVYHQ
jgi:hypothetical protein